MKYAVYYNGELLHVYDDKSCALRFAEAYQKNHAGKCVIRQVKK